MIQGLKQVVMIFTMDIVNGHEIECRHGTQLTMTMQFEIK